MDFYFTDRNFNLIEVATTTANGGYSLTNDELVQSITGGSKTFTADLPFTPEQEKRVTEMAKVGNYVLFIDSRGHHNFQTIMETKKANFAINITCLDATVDLADETVDAYTADKAYPIAHYLELFTRDSGFEIGINEISNLSRKLKWDSTDETSKARILSVATQFDAELDFTFEITGTRVIKRYINIRKHNGSDKDIRLTLNHEINTISTSENIWDLATSIRAIGGTPEGKDKPIDLNGYKWTDPDGRYKLSGATLLDTVANQYWTRLRTGGTSDTGAYINRVITYSAVTQAELLQSALADLKKRASVATTYEVDIAVLPDNVEIGDTVHIVDEKQELFLSARVLELTESYAFNTHKATLGDYLIEENEVSLSLQQLAEKMKTLASKPVYTWIAYADTADGQGISLFPDGKAYTGIAVNMADKETDISDPSKFNWQLTKGEPGQPGKDGTNGTPGAKGADGRTSYFHTAWADSENGSIGFTTSGGNGKKYVGTYSDFTQADSTEPSKYNWALFKGTDGKDGYTPIKGTDYFDGKDGQDGKSSYLWIKYSANADGTNMTSDPTGAKYVGYATTQTAIAPTLASAYKWQLVAGKDGIPGEKGTDGKTSYLHIRYSNDGGKTFTANSGENVGTYIGQYTDFTQSDSNSVSAYKWALIKGEKGDTGKDGIAGKDGIGIKSTQIMYAQSTSGTTAPTTGWTAQVPTLIKGQYLWTQTAWVYTDNTGEAGYTVSYNAKDGNTGANGIAGKDGVGIKSTSITYQGGTSGTVHPAGTWVANPPSVAGGNYLWTRTVWSYTDGTSETGYSVAKMGEKGEKGEKGDTGVGIAGTPGKDGRTPYVHTAWSRSSDGVEGFSNYYPGENLISGSEFDRNWSIPSQATIVNGYDGHKAINVDATGLTSGWLDVQQPIYTGDVQLIKSGEWYTISFYAKGTGYIETYIYPSVVDTSAGSYVDGVFNESAPPDGYHGWTLTDKYVRHSWSFKAKTPLSPTTNTGNMLFRPKAGNSTYASLPKLEQGTTATPWYPSPTDDPINAYPSYRGEYTDYTEADSNDPTKYEWALVKGTDGKSSYTHIAYANSANGVTDFTVSDSNRTYIGMYVDFTETDSTKPADYSWSLIKGANGADGTPGKAGADGKTPYFHIAYADSADGKNGFYVGGGTNLLINTSSSSANGRTVMQGASAQIFGEYSRTDSYEQVTTPSSGEFYYRFMNPDPNKLYGLTQGETYTLSGSASHTSGSLSFRVGYGINGSSWSEDVIDLGIPVSDGSVFTPFSHTFTIKVGSTGVYFSLQNYDYTNGGLFRFKNMKLEKGNISTPWSPAPSEAHPIYMGTYTDYTQADSLDPTKYTWTLIKGDKGDKGETGPKGDPGSKDVPVITSGTSFPATRKTGDMHWMTNSAGVVTGYYKFNGSQWVVQKIDAQSLNVPTLSALSANLGTINAGTINGVDINASTYKASYKHALLDGDVGYTDTYSTGDMTISNGKVIIDGNVETDEGVDSGQRYNTSLLPSGFSNYVTNDDGTTYLNDVIIAYGQIGLSSLVSGLGTNAKYLSTGINAESLYLNSTSSINWLSGWSNFAGTPTIFRFGAMVAISGYIQTSGSNLDIMRVPDWAKPASTSFGTGTAFGVTGQNYPSISMSFIIDTNGIVSVNRPAMPNGHATIVLVYKGANLI